MSDVAKCPLCQKYIDNTFKQNSCPKCGGNISGYELKNEAAKYSPYYGVGGWLLLFCVSLTILGPLVNLGSIGRNLSEVNQSGTMLPSLVTIVYVEAALALVLTAFSIYAGVSLWMIRPKAVGTAKIYLIVLVVFSVIDLLLVMTVELPAPVASAAMGAGIGAIVRSAIYAGIWFAYLSKSERVYATYLAE